MTRQNIIIKKCVFIQFYDKLKSSFQSSEEFLAHYRLPPKLILFKKKIARFYCRTAKNWKRKHLWLMLLNLWCCNYTLLLAPQKSGRWKIVLISCVVSLNFYKKKVRYEKKLVIGIQSLVEFVFVFPFRIYRCQKQQAAVVLHIYVPFLTEFLLL